MSVYSYKGSRFFSKKSFRAPDPPKEHTPTPSSPRPVDFFKKNSDVKLPSKPSADPLQKKIPDPKSKSWDDVMKELTEQSNRIKQRRQANINGKGDSFSFN
jgi:hypothetical protein